MTARRCWHDGARLTADYPDTPLCDACWGRLEAKRGDGRCEFCDQAGSVDTRVGWTRQGRRNQGAMTPRWTPAMYSRTLDAVACPLCFKRRFYRITCRLRRRAERRRYMSAAARSARFEHEERERW